MMDDDWTMLRRKAIRWLAVIIITAVGGIIGLSLWGLALRYGVVGDGLAEGADAADEALSILGNVASAAVGAIAGWLSRDAVERALPPDDDTIGAEPPPDPAALDEPPPADAARPAPSEYPDDDDEDEWLDDNDPDGDDARP